MECIPDAKVVMGGSFPVSYLAPFFLAFFLVKDPGRKQSDLTSRKIFQHVLTHITTDEGISVLIFFKKEETNLLQTKTFLPFG